MSAKEVNRKIVGNERYTLNVTEGLTDRIIKNAREKITQLQASKEKMQPELEELREYHNKFVEIETQFRNIDMEIHENEVIISTMTVYKNKSGKKRLVVQGTPDGTKGIGGSNPKRISWLDEAHIILQKNKHWMTAADLVGQISLKQHIVETVKGMKTPLPAMKFSAIATIETHATQTSMGKERSSNRFKPLLTIHNDLIGCFDWVDEKNMPRAEFLKDFIAHNSKK